MRLLGVFFVVVKSMSRGKVDDVVHEQGSIWRQVESDNFTPEDPVIREAKAVLIKPDGSQEALLNVTHMDGESFADLDHDLADTRNASTMALPFADLLLPESFLEIALWRNEDHLKTSADGAGRYDYGRASLPEALRQVKERLHNVFSTDRGFRTKWQLSLAQNSFQPHSSDTEKTGIANYYRIYHSGLEVSPPTITSTGGAPITKIFSNLFPSRDFTPKLMSLVYAPWQVGTGNNVGGASHQERLVDEPYAHRHIFVGVRKVKAGGQLHNQITLFIENKPDMMPAIDIPKLTEELRVGNDEHKFDQAPGKKGLGDGTLMGIASSVLAGVPEAREPVDDEAELTEQLLDGLQSLGDDPRALAAAEHELSPKSETGAALWSKAAFRLGLLQFLRQVEQTQENFEDAAVGQDI